MLKLKTTEVVRRMRPFQRNLALWIIHDVEIGNAPASLEVACQRYLELLGSEVLFDTEKGWSGDLRQEALWTLLHNGFARAGMVKMNDNQLVDWLSDSRKLWAAANIEIEHGGNQARSIKAAEIAPDVQIFGEGSRCVYVYVDSRLEALRDHCTKIGRHDKSGVGEVLGRVLAQYGTGNAGFPVLKYIFRTENEVYLEAMLHQHFAAQRINQGIGTEWFEASIDDILNEARKHVL